MTKKKHQVLHEPFDITMTIRVIGVTRSDGEKTLTTSMVVDKTCAPAYQLLDEHLLGSVETQVKDNLAEAQEIIAKSKRGY